MDRLAWPERDRRWAARYRSAIAGHVPAAVLEHRGGELLDAVRAAGLPAAGLLGDADDLAAEDASELATAHEAVRTSDGGGLRPALREVGGTLAGVGAVGAVLVVAARMPQQALRQDWDDAAWLRRFRGGLASRLVPAATARAHVAEVEQQVAVLGVPAHAEFGHPLVLAREVAGADRDARARRWWITTAAGAGAPLVIGLVLLLDDGWGALTVPLGVVLVLAGLSRPVLARGARPRARRA